MLQTSFCEIFCLESDIMQSFFKINAGWFDILYVVQSHMHIYVSGLSDFVATATFFIHSQAVHLKFRCENASHWNVESRGTTQWKQLEAVIFIPARLHCKCSFPLPCGSLFSRNQHYELLSYIVNILIQLCLIARWTFPTEKKILSNFITFGCAVFQRCYFSSSVFSSGLRNVPLVC